MNKTIKQAERYEAPVIEFVQVKTPNTILSGSIMSPDYVEHSETWDEENN